MFGFWGPPSIHRINRKVERLEARRKTRQLVKLLELGDDDVDASVLAALSRLADRNTFNLLVSYTRTGNNGSAAYHAASGIVRIDPERALKVFIDNLGYVSRNTRENAVRSLAELGHPGAIRSLAAALEQEKQADIHDAIVEALNRIAVSAGTISESDRNAAGEAVRKHEASIRSTREKEQEEKQRASREKREEQARLMKQAAEMSSPEQVELLKRLCAAYSSGDEQYRELEPLAYCIGVHLDSTGGIASMRSMFDRLWSMPGSRTLEMHWNGIGEWRG